MKTNVRNTSLTAYNELKQGKLSTQQQTILNHLQHGKNYSLQEIVKITGYAINAVSGRVNNLKKLNLLVESIEKRPCSITGKTIQPVELPAMPVSQKELF